MADLTFRALLVAVDDFGRMDADPLILKAELFPRRPDVTPEMVSEWVGELAQEGCVQLYRVDGAEYVALTKWETHRGKGRRAEESRYPGPENADSSSADFLGNPRNVNAIRPRGIGTLGIGTLGICSGVQGGAQNAPAAAEPPETTGARALFEQPPAEKRRRGRSRKPQTEPPEQLPDEQREMLTAWAAEHEPWAISRLRELERLCLDHHRARGNRGSDWLAAVRNWVTRERNFREERKTTGRSGPATSGRPSVPDWSQEIAAAEAAEESA